MSERDIELIMRQPWNMTSTDGDLVPMGQGKPHPRAYGAFPRKLRLYVRDRGVVDLPFAIRSMTSLPAQVFAMKDRGQIRAGRLRGHPALRSSEGERRRDLSGASPARRRHDAHRRQRRAGARGRQVLNRAAGPRARRWNGDEQL